MHTLALVTVFLLSLIPATAQNTKPSADLTGKWTGTFTRTAPDGQKQSLAVEFNFTQKGKVLTGTVGPNAERQWAFEKGGTVDAGKISFKVQQPDGPLRTFTLKLEKEKLVGQMLAEMNGQSFTADVNAERAK